MSSTPRVRTAVEGSDLVAATLVVGQDSIESDFRSIQDAYDALPPEGGTIFILQGHYILPASVVLGAKPVLIRGSGTGLSLFGTTSGTVLDLGVNAFSAFTIPGAVADFTASITLENIQFLGTLVAGQHAVRDGSSSGVTIRSCEFTGIDRIISTEGANGSLITIEDCGSFTINTIADGAGAINSSIAMDQCLLFINGPVAIGQMGCDLSNCAFNTFGGAFTMAFSTLSRFVSCRFVFTVMTIPAGFPSGECLFSACAWNGGNITVTGDNNAFNNCIFDFGTAITVSGKHNRFVNLRHLGGGGITEVGAADFNHYDAVDNFSGYTIIGPNSQIGSGNFRNVIDWGADASGVADSTAAIQAAINSLPATGGIVFFPAGTYFVTSTLTMPDKSVRIMGSGWGTIFSLNASGGFQVFTIPDGLTDERQYEFESFKISAPSVAGSGIIILNDTSANGYVVLRSIRSEGIQRMIEIAAGDFFNFSKPVIVDVYDSWFVPSSTYFSPFGGHPPVSANSAVLCTMDGNEFPNHVSMHNTYFMVDELTSTGGSIDGDNFSGLDISFYDCTLSLVQEDGFNSIHAERCSIFNFVGQGVSAFPNTIFLGGVEFNAGEFHPTCAFINCYMAGMSWDISEGVNVVGGWWDSTTISASVTNGKCQITGTVFRTDNFNVPQFPHFGATPTSYVNGGSELNIISCRFSGGVNRYIEARDSFYIGFCAFQNLGAGVDNCGIHVTGPNNFICFNDFDSLWAAPPVKEEGNPNTTVNGNVYDGNVGLNGNGGTDSVFVATSHVTPRTFEGQSMFHQVGNTTDNFVLITMGPLGLGTSDPGLRRNPSGLTGGGTIFNSGGNSMDIRETVIDDFGVTESVVTTVVAGAKQPLKTLDDQFNAPGGTAFPPYVQYKIEVKSTVAGNPTSFEYRHTLNAYHTW